jgi:hypothetical protein
MCIHLLLQSVLQTYSEHDQFLSTSLNLVEQGSVSFIGPDEDGHGKLYNPADPAISATEVVRL